MGLRSLTGRRAFLRTTTGRRNGANGHPESAHELGRCTHIHRARYTGARACKYQHSRARVHRRAPWGGHCQSLGKLGRTRTDLRALGVSTAVPQRPLVLLSRLATDTPSPAFSLPLYLDPNPALAWVESSSSPSRQAQVSRWDVPVAREGRGCSGARCAHEHLGRLSSHRV